MTTPLTLAQAAREAVPALAALSAQDRNRALLCAAETLRARCEDIFEANRADLARAREQHLAAPLLSRLRFDEAKLRSVLDGLQALAALVLLLLGYRFGMSAVQAQDVMQPLGELVRGTGRSLCTLGRSAVQTVRDLMREAQTARG